MKSISGLLGIQFLFSLEDFNHELINFIDTKAKCRHLKKLTCKWTLRQVFLCLSPPRLLGFCLGWSSNFIGSESGQIHSVKLLQNVVFSRTQHPTPSPSHTLSVQYVLYVLYFETGGGGRELNQREGDRGNSSQSWVEYRIPT